MPSLFSRLRPGPGRCPRWLWGRRPRRLRRPPPPPPEGLPGPAFIVLSSCCVHVQNFTDPKGPASRRIPPFQARLRPSHKIGSTQLRVATGHTVERTPTLQTNCYSRIKPCYFLTQYRFSVYRIRQAPPRIGWRGRPARERGPNENNFMVLVIAQPRKAPPAPILHRRPCLKGFRVGVRMAILGRSEGGLHIPLDTSRAHCCACQ